MVVRHNWRLTGCSWLSIQSAMIRKK